MAVVLVTRRWRVWGDKRELSLPKSRHTSSVLFNKEKDTHAHAYYTLHSTRVCCLHYLLSFTE